MPKDELLVDIDNLRAEVSSYITARDNLLRDLKEATNLNKELTGFLNGAFRPTQLKDLEPGQLALVWEEHNGAIVWFYLGYFQGVSEDYAYIFTPSQKNRSFISRYSVDPSNNIKVAACPPVITGASIKGGGITKPLPSIPGAIIRVTKTTYKDLETLAVLDAHGGWRKLEDVSKPWISSSHIVKWEIVSMRGMGDNDIFSPF